MVFKGTSQVITDLIGPQMGDVSDKEKSAEIFHIKVMPWICYMLEEDHDNEMPYSAKSLKKFCYCKSKGEKGMDIIKRIIWQIQILSVCVT